MTIEKYPIWQDWMLKIILVPSILLCIKYALKLVKYVFFGWLPRCLSWLTVQNILNFIKINLFHNICWTRFSELLDIGFVCKCIFLYT